MADLFFLQDSRSNVGSRAMFWKLGGGYTSNLDQAEQFTRERAVKQYECRETDLPWPVDYVRARSEVGVDCQYLDPEAAAQAASTDGCIYVAYHRDWDGNDLVWLSKASRRSSNLLEASTWSADHAVGFSARGYQVWPVSYIDGKSRRVAPVAQLNHKKALREAGLKLPKVKRQRIRRYLTNCGGCGRFLSDRQIYGECPNCGEYNGP